MIFYSADATTPSRARCYRPAFHLRSTALCPPLPDERWHDKICMISSRYT